MRALQGGVAGIRQDGNRAAAELAAAAGWWAAAAFGGAWPPASATSAALHRSSRALTYVLTRFISSQPAGGTSPSARGLQRNRGIGSRVANATLRGLRPAVRVRIAPSTLLVLAGVRSCQVLRGSGGGGGEQQQRARAATQRALAGAGSSRSSMPPPLFTFAVLADCQYADKVSRGEGVQGSELQAAESGAPLLLMTKKRVGTASSPLSCCSHPRQLCIPQS